MRTTPPSQLDWAPAACTLPTASRPLRLAEFDALFAGHLQQVHRIDAGRLRLTLTPGAQVAGTAAALAARETACCSFFTFELTITDGTLHLAVSAPSAHSDVLAALADRAESSTGAAT